MVWVFGYGSLIWKVDFSYTRKIVGFIKGYHRRFWQGSTDHRGRPGQPGRVVTLVDALDDADAEVWGVAYELPADREEMVLQQLDYRERDGYSRQPVAFYPKDDEEHNFEVHVYIADNVEANPDYLGPASMRDMALQIYSSEGLSGKNIEYLVKLAIAMRELVPEVKDDHLFKLEREVNLLCELGSEREYAAVG